jgi:ABC-type transporter Mla subunit MlaD
MRKRLKNCLAAALTAALILCMIPLTVISAFADGGDKIYINSAEDLKALAEKCSLDTWSRGKTVLLTCDIDLSGISFSPVPTFGGIFDGQSHTITSLTVSASGSALGMFRYLQDCGVVKNLNLTCSVAPSGTECDIGGIVGVNQGSVVNCKVDGNITGSEEIGGIAGINKGSGIISQCSSQANVTGSSKVGGIAGTNLGTVMYCTNSGSVNTVSSDTGISIEGLDADEIIDQFTSTSDGGSIVDDEGITASDESDAGGIAGYSSGIIQSCSNDGTIGYAHVGYNIGGIAGRQCGYIDSCSNSGVVSGRKDVGGIVGQAEPYIIVDPDGTTLERLSSALDSLNSLTNTALNHVDEASSEISDHITAIGNYSDSANESTRNMYDDLSAFLGDSTGEGGSFISQIVGSSDRVSESISGLENTSGSIATTSDQLDTILKSLEASSQQDTEVYKNVKAASEDYDHAEHWIDEAKDDLSPVSKKLHNAVDGATSLDDIDMDDIQDAIKDTDESREDLEKASEYLGSASASLEDAQSLAENSPGEYSEETIEQLKTAASSAAVTSSYFSDAVSRVNTVSDNLANADPISLSQLSEDFHKNSEDLYISMTGISEEVTGLSNSLKSGSETLTNDLRAISDQFNVVMQLLVTAIGDIESAGDRTLSDIIKDTSEEDLNETKLGKISNCYNYGIIAADRSVGGIAGSMALENDLDPEDDYVTVISYFSIYESKAVLQNDINSSDGEVIVRKDCGGGICGRMDLGTAFSCQNYGHIESTDGNYVGGIAGQSNSSVRKCYSKCSLSGGSYVGGIAGFGDKITDCCSLVIISEASEYFGSVSGYADVTTGYISGNYYIDTGWAAIDSISYSGAAEAIDFNKLKQFSGIPVDFVSFKLSLYVDGKLLSQIPFAYGDNLSALALPEVPVKENYYGEWPDFDTTGVYGDVTINAVYTPWVTVLASAESSADGISLALAEGQYTEDAVLDVTDSAIAPPVETKSGQDLTVWDIELAGTEVRDGDTVTVRLFNTGGGKAVVWAYVNGAWAEIPAQANGQYLITTMTGTENTFCVLSNTGAYLNRLILLAALAALACLVLIVVIGFIAKHRKKHKVTSTK